jgi:PAS domain S-box-containing protein
MDNDTKMHDFNELIEICRKILNNYESQNRSKDISVSRPENNREDSPDADPDGEERGAGNKQLLRKLLPVLLKITFLTCIFFSLYEGIKSLLFAHIILWQSHIITIIFAGLVASFGAYFPLKKIEILYQKSISELVARKRAQAVLRESEERYRQLFELESDALFLVDEKTDQIIEVNAAGEKLYGLTRKDFLEMKCEDLMDRSSEPITNSELNLRSDFIFHRRSNGAIFPVEISVSKVNWYGKKVRLSAVRDITERLNAQRKIENQRAFLRKVIDVNPNYIYVINRENTIVLANRIFAGALGMAPEQLIGMKLKDLPPKLDFTKIVQRDEILALNHEKAWIEREENFMDIEGKHHWILSIRVPLKNEDGHIEGLIGVSTDITQRKQAEDALKIRETELEMKSQNLEEVNTALKVLLKQREQDKREMEELFLTNVKDQVMPYVEKLKKSKQNQEQMVCIETLETHLNDIISPFSTNITSKYINLTPKEVQVATLIKDGKTTKEISLLLNISPGSVDLHRYHIRRKLGISKQDVNLRSYLLSMP